MTEETEMSPIRTDTFIQERARDDFCKDIISNTEKKESEVHKVDGKRLLVRVSPVGADRCPIDVSPEGVTPVPFPENHGASRWYQNVPYAAARVVLFVDGRRRLRHS